MCKTYNKIEKEKHLIIFDEIQECPDALNSLKYFCEDANDYHIVAAGSLLGTLLSELIVGGLPECVANWADSPGVQKPCDSTFQRKREIYLRMRKAGCPRIRGGYRMACKCRARSSDL